MSELNMEPNAQPTTMPLIQIPACQKCGRQDETLRLVVYPFIFSVVVITYRRALSGLWCKTHRTQNQMIASLISSIFGWIGIPSGLIFTPIVLIQLAKGGVQPVDANIKILATLAEDKLKKGDTTAAVRCLEECLKFRDDPEIKKRLNEIRPRYGAETESIGCLQIGFRLIGALIVSILIGTSIGVLNYVSGYFISKIIGNEIPLFAAILSWAPLIAGAFIGGLGMARIIEQTLVKIKSRRNGLAISFAIFAALSVTYGIFEGIIISDNIYSVLSGQFQSIGQIIGVSIVTLFIGGLIGLAVTLQSMSSQIFFLIIILIATIFLLFIGIWTARETIRWQQRISIDVNI